MLLYGPEIERAGGWDAGIEFAERLRAPVYMTPLSDKTSFPQSHTVAVGTIKSTKELQCDAPLHCNDAGRRA